MITRINLDKNNRMLRMEFWEDEVLVYPPEVLEKMWDQVFPVLSDKTIGKPIITGTSGGI